MKKYQYLKLILLILMIINISLIIIILYFENTKYLDGIILFTAGCNTIAAAFLWIMLRYNDMKFRYYTKTKDVEFLREFCTGFSEDSKKAFEEFASENDREALLLAKGKEAQLLALQNQINPHFLYNTLETIRSDAIIKGVDSIANMSESLAVFFRYTISNLDRLVRVEEELDNVLNYYSIQKYRFGNKLQLNIDISEAENMIQRQYMPKLILQPIVENAIYHGLEQKMGLGKVTIRMKDTSDQLLIVVSDNGIGIPEKQLKELNQRLYEAEPDATYHHSGKSGIAMENVNQRIKILFGKEYGIYIRSVENIGTDVNIKLPKISQYIGASAKS